MHTVYSEFISKTHINFIDCGHQITIFELEYHTIFLYPLPLSLDKLTEFTVQYGFQCVYIGGVYIYHVHFL